MDTVDSHFLNGIGTITAFLAIVAVTVWAFSKKRKKRFEEAAQLPFADENIADRDHGPEPEPGNDAQRRDRGEEQ